MLDNKQILLKLSLNIEDFKRQIAESNQSLNKLRQEFDKGFVSGKNSKELKDIQKELKNTHNYAKKLFSEQIKQEKEALKIKKENKEISNKQYKEELNNIKLNADTQKKADLEHEKRLKDLDTIIKNRQRTEKEHAQQVKNQQEAEKRNQDELKRKDQERLKIIKQQEQQYKQQLDTLNKIKSVGSTISSVGTAMVGAGVGGYALVNKGAKTYLDFALEMGRMLNIKSKDLQGTTNKQWEEAVLQNAYKYGVNPKEMARYTTDMLNASSVYGTAAGMSSSANMMAVTGISGESMATAMTMYNNKLKHDGWENEEHYLDALLTMFSMGTESPEEMTKYFNQASVYASDYTRGNPTSLMQLMAIASRQAKGEMSMVTSAVRQFISDVEKKNLPEATRIVAQAKGMSVPDYIYSITGKKVDNFDSIPDIHNLGLIESAMLAASVGQAAKSIDGTFRVKEGKDKNGNDVYKTVTAKELSSELLSTLSGNVKGKTLLQIIDSARLTGELNEVQEAFKDENMRGSLKSTTDAYYKSDAGKIETSIQRISASVMTLVARMSPFFVGFFDKLVEWTDFLKDLNFEDLVEKGEAFANILGLLISFGAPLIAIGKTIQFIAGMDFAWKYLKYNLTGTSNVLGATAGSIVNSGNIIGKSATNTANAMGGSTAAVVGKFGILVGYIGVAITSFAMLIDIINDVVELVNTEAMKSARTDWKNGVDSEAAREYEKQLNDPWFRLWESIGLTFDGNDENDHVKTNGELGNSQSIITSLTDLGLNFLDSGFGVYPLLEKLGVKGAEDFSLIEGIGITGEYIADTLGWAYLKNQSLSLMELSEMINNHDLTKNLTENEKIVTQDKYQGEYKGDSDNNLLDQLKPEDSTYTPIEYDPINAEDIYNAMEDGAAAGTEKGVKNALSGDYNIPGSYTKLSQNGLAELVGFDNFGVKRTGNTVTMKNDININITADGQNADVIASIVEQRLSEFFRGSTLLDI